MCILAVASCSNRRIPFALISNRDEFLHRPTAAASIRIAPGTGDRLVYCADQQAVATDGGVPGTWLGVNLTRGTFATVTNSRFIGRRAREIIANDPDLPLLSRGWLVRDALLSPTGRLSESANAAWWLRQQTARAASAPVLAAPQPKQPATEAPTADPHAATTDDVDVEWRRILSRRMNGFNLISGSLRAAAQTYYTSNTAPGEPFELPLESSSSSSARSDAAAGPEGVKGCFNAVSNSYLDCALEPRVAHLRRRLKEILSDPLPQSDPPQSDGVPLAHALESGDPLAIADVLGAPLLDSLNVTSVPASDLLDVPRKFRRVAAALERGAPQPIAATVSESDSDTGEGVVDFANADVAREAALRVSVARALQQNVYTAPLLLPYGGPSKFAPFGTRTQIVVFVMLAPVDSAASDKTTGDMSTQREATVHFCVRNIEYADGEAAGIDFRKGIANEANPPVPRVTAWQHFSAPLNEAEVDLSS